MNKLEALRKELKEKGIDAVVIFDELNQKYLSDFAFTDGLLLITAARACLLTFWPLSWCIFLMAAVSA